jgi:hypothetical protein
LRLLFFGSKRTASIVNDKNTRKKCCYFVNKCKKKQIGPYIKYLDFAFTFHQRDPGRATHSNNNNQGKSKKQILIGPRVFGSGELIRV